jgi:GH35 family endo-1,4-beta-xylanase
MKTEWTFRIVCLLTPSLVAANLVLAGCKPGPVVGPTNTAVLTATQASTLAPTLMPALTPTNTATAAPTPEPYASWSTNFTDVTDPAASGMFGWGENYSLSLDTSNVNSGGKSIKTTGTVAKAWSAMGLTFNLANLLGVNSVDLSDKTLRLEVYVPQGSPLYRFYIDVHSPDQYVQVRIFLDDVYLGQWHTYTADVAEDIALKSWRERAGEASPNLTDDQAANLLKHAQAIGIYAVPEVDHPSTQAYFEVDSLGWAPSGPFPTYDPSVDSLRRFAPPNLPVGGWMEVEASMDHDAVRNLVQEFNLVTTMSWFPQTEPPGDVLTYDTSWSPRPDADYLNDTNGTQLLRYSGMGANPTWMPDWLTNKTYDEVGPILEGFVRGVVDHYKGKTFIWNLFNELLCYDLNNPNCTGLRLKSRKEPSMIFTNDYAPWANDSSDLALVEDAFRVARQADPQALLIVNDAGAGEGTPAGDAVYALAAKLKADGTPIDGVGLETHIFLDQYDHFSDHRPDPISFDPVYGFTDIAENVERFAALGLKVAFTEVDIPIYLGDIDLSTPAGKDLLAHRRQLQAAAYRSLLHIALTHPNVVALSTWDFQDQYTWADPADVWARSPGYGKDLGLMDRSFQKKPAYYALLDELKAAPAALPGAFSRTSPAEGATAQPNSLTLSWGPSAGATGYQYCLAGGLSDSCASWISTGTSTQATVRGLLPNTPYSWQVRAVGPGGVIHANSGNWGTFKTVDQTAFTFSTNFAEVTDPAASGFGGGGGNFSLSLDTSNVHSGGKSVKVTATVGPAKPAFEMRVYMKSLGAPPTYDFSDKTVSFEVYLPPDSPLDFLTLLIRHSEPFVNVGSAGAGALYKGRWHTYTVDISQYIRGRAWKVSPWLITSGMTDDDVLSTLKNADCLSLYGGVNSPSTDKVTTLLLDQVTWSGH